MELEPRFSRDEIAEAVARIAEDISRDHPEGDLLLVGILRGSFVFLADLVRALTVEAEVDFLRARSYGAGMTTSGAVEITKDIETDVTGRDVIIVEDILDTGLTLEVVRKRIEAGHAARVQTCALLVREGSAPPDYMGLWAPPGFVVGYGIDYAERYRGLPEIWSIKGTEHL
ncbi:MAG TPA: hypoxanthine phosphoribosyltransferase [Actinobacteria bacterium]|nr:hypoxanthine phosphoribosyltransferase [Actinomycetota bacterium]